jgi:orotidine-5'-phosphate decarboxylase
METNFIVVALDFPTEFEAFRVIDQLDPETCRVKVGKELFTRLGPSVIRRAVDAGFDVFLDLKYHDIPNTVAGACKAAAELGCWMINVHASGGRAMMEAAVEGLSHHRIRPLLVGVTVLTSMVRAAIEEVGYQETPEKLVLRLATLSRDCGLDGVVCSPHEIRPIKDRLGQDFLTVTPGVRPPAASSDDQSRVATPAEARAAGGDYLVIGRPITRTANCRSAVAEIYAGIAADPNPN